MSGAPRAAVSPSAALTAQEGPRASQGPGRGAREAARVEPRPGAGEPGVPVRVNKETSLRSAPVCVLSVLVQRAAWPCALLLTWPRAAPSLAGQLREPSLTTAVLAKSRCCLPAGAHPGLPCCTCPWVPGSWGRGCVPWVRSPGVLDPQSPCGVPSPPGQQGPWSGGRSRPEVSALASWHRGSAAGATSGTGSITWRVGRAGVA